MMKKKLGPLPVWGWAAIGAGVLLVMYLRSRSASSHKQATSNLQNVDPNSPLGLTYAQEQADLAAGIDPNTGNTFAAESAAALGAGGDSSQSGVTDQRSGAQDLVTELKDITAGIMALRAFEALFVPKPPQHHKKHKHPKKHPDFAAIEMRISSLEHELKNPHLSKTRKANIIDRIKKLEHELSPSQRRRVERYVDQLGLPSTALPRDKQDRKPRTRGSHTGSNHTSGKPRTPTAPHPPGWKK